MRKIWCSLLLGIVMLLGIKVAAEDIYTSISPVDLRKWMQTAGYSVSIDNDGDIQWKIDDYNTYITFYKENKSIQFFTIFDNNGATLQKLNDFNRDRRYGKTYLNKKGALVLESDLDLDGGVTKESIMNYVKTCSTLFSLWRKEVL